MSELSLTRFKRCVICTVTKPLDPRFFHRQARAYDGFHSYCKVCKSFQDRWRAPRRREKNRKQIREYNRRWRDENREVVRGYARTFRERNLGRERLRKRVLEQNRQNKIIGGYVAEQAISQMYVDQKGLCAYCEIVLGSKWHLEHMTPLSRGGTHRWDNIALTCAPCNRKKGTKTVEEFFLYLKDPKER